MRKIKFRVWIKSKKTLLERVIGFVIDHNKKRFRYFRLDETQPDGISTNVFDLSGIELMQFTGLKDKNDVDIYEGDIVRVLYTDWMSKLDSDKRKLEEYLKDIAHIGVVSFYDYGWFVRIKDHYSSIIHGKHGYIEVIGNIHENKDLLK